MDSFPYASALYWENQNWTPFSRCSLTDATEGKDQFPGAAGYIHALQPRKWLAFDALISSISKL